MAKGMDKKKVTKGKPKKSIKDKKAAKNEKKNK